MTQLGQTEADLVCFRLLIRVHTDIAGFQFVSSVLPATRASGLASPGAYLVSSTHNHLRARSVRAACHTASRPPLVPVVA
jgi:hypothetical protein